jgi:hypothetical protein
MSQCLPRGTTPLSPRGAHRSLRRGTTPLDPPKAGDTRERAQ